MHLAIIFLQIIFATVSNPEEPGKTWVAPAPCFLEPVLYSFDNMDGLVLMEGTEQKNYAPLVSGRVKL